MQAILTTSKSLKRGNTNVTARTASGKIAQRHCYENTFAEHLKAAQTLSRRMGWGENLVSGETKEGFAFIPAAIQSSSVGVSWEAVEKATKQLMQAATAFPNGEKDPIRLASGIIDLAKTGH